MSGVNAPAELILKNSENEKMAAHERPFFRLIFGEANFLKILADVSRKMLLHLL